MMNAGQEIQDIPRNPFATPGSWLPLFQLMWRRRRVLIRAAVLGLAAAAAIAFIIPNRYQSTLQLMPPDPQSLDNMAMLAAMGGNFSSSGAAGLASSFLGIRSTGATLVGILQSRTVQDDLINRFDLRKVYGYKRYMDARKKLAARTSIDEDRKTGLISIVVTDNNAVRARDIAGAYAEELDKLVTQLSTSSARRERVFLEERLQAVKQDLDNASRQLSQFSSKNATFDMQDQGRAMMEAAAKLQGELIAAQSELRGLETIYSTNNVRVRSVQARISELQRQLQKMGGSGGDTNASELPASELYPPLRKLPLLGVTYYDLYRRTKIQETLYEILTKQYELAKVQEAKEIPTVKILDPPDIPEKKSFPPRLLIIIGGTFMAVIGGIAYVVANEVWLEADDAQPVKAFVQEVFRRHHSPVTDM